MSANAGFVYVLSTIHILTFPFANSSSIPVVNGEISSTGHFFVTDAYYQSSLASQTTNAEAVVYVDEHQCRRQCAISETCQAYLTFTNVLPVLETCYLYDRDVCVTDPNLLGINTNVLASKLLSQVPGDQEPRPCNTSSDGSMTIATPTETEASTMLYTDNTTIEATTLPTTVFTNLSNNSAIPEVSTTESVGSTNLMENTTVATVVPANSTTIVPPEPRPRTCWEYHTMLNIIDKGDWYLRVVWPSGFSDVTSISVYCRNGYTLILSN